MIASALTRSGLRVGLYTSPHLVDVRERMLVDGRPISEDAFAQWTNMLVDEIERVGASFFEATTAVAFADFAARGADVAVVEVGLGGRLDSTNVIAPLVSAVTCVSLEHTDYLGDSIAEIAREKAGIAKAGTPFIIGELDPAVASVLIERAEEAGAMVEVVPADSKYPGELDLHGPHQDRNAAIAAAVLQALPSELRPGEREIAEGIASAWLPGRFDCRGKWVFDVAHNPAAIGALVDNLRAAEVDRPIHGLLGVLNDKDARYILRVLDLELDALWVTTPPSAPENRLSDLDALAQLAGDNVVIEPDFARALAGVQTGAATVLVTGSFHTVGDAMNRLPGFAPLG
jgi:dihydrofolate synthase/folylpolyglutamate synthase